jgi:exodeoxyribonuclease VII large subunit
MTIDTGPPTVDSPWSVAHFSGKVKGWIERLGTAWVEGEITQWGLSGGNVYGKLKDLDQDVTISFTIWSSVKARLPVDLKQGDRVLALVKPTYWLKAGTGKDSDAEKDVLRNAQLRWPAVKFRVVHATVQGERAAREVAGAIRALDADPEVEVIIIARGGGDFQNLLVFSDEALVRAAAASSTPIVSAIGHEADRPLLDEVADLRASTPTDAAKRVVPDVAEELARVTQAQRLSAEVDRLVALRSRPVLASPAWLIDTRADDLGRYVTRSRDLIERCIERAHTGVVELTSQLRALSPQRTLERGYAIAQLPDGSALRSAGDAPAGTRLLLTVADGKLSTTVDPPAPTHEHAR